MIVPATRYRDPEAALAFLKAAFGLTEHAVYRDEAGVIVHAQLRAGQGMVMFGPSQGGAFDELMVAPDEVGGRETTTIYVVVPDVRAVLARAEAAEARILVPLEPQGHGGESFTAADPEGHVWTFGDYDPFAG
ncbi:glyoxalase [Aquicoccus sp. SCR17]|nr:glyoxalase [Carideicomes alvinocaridis]